MNLKQQRAAALKAAQDIVEKVKAAGRGLTEEEQKSVAGHLAEVDSIDVKLKAAEESDALMARLTSHSAPEQTGPGVKARSLGEHFVKSVGAQGLARVKTVSGATVAAPEFAPEAAKAATDTQGTPAVMAPWLTTFDRTVVRAFRRPVVSDLLGQGSLGANSNAVAYLVEGAIEGGFTTVAPGGAKPQFHIADPEQRTDPLRKIAGFLKFTDEMVEDADFWVSEINQRGLYMLALAEENLLQTVRDPSLRRLYGMSQDGTEVQS